MSLEAIALLVFVLLLLFAAYPLWQSDLRCVKKVKTYFGDQEHGHWWSETTRDLWLTSQTCSLFLDVESVAPPAPFSWLVSAMNFVTLGPLAAFFYSPCASCFAGRKSKTARVDAAARRALVT